MKQHFLIVAFVAVVGLSLLLQLYTVGFAPKEITDQRVKNELLNKIVKLESKIFLLKEQLQKTKTYAGSNQKEYIDVLLEDLSMKQASLEYAKSISASAEILPSQLLSIQASVQDTAQELELTAKVTDTLEQGVKQKLSKPI